MSDTSLLTIPARHGMAARMRRSQLLRVGNTHGDQVVDTWAFNPDNLSEFMSMEHSRAGMLKVD